ncbi:hypothetical protein MPER_02806, partial [Moniliophthora perniciosa FA553]
CTLKVVQIVLSIMATIQGTQIQFFMLIADNERLMTMCITALSSAAAIDIICATALSYYLHSSRSGIQRSDTLINKLIIHSINNVWPVSPLSSLWFRSRKTSYTLHFLRSVRELPIVDAELAKITRAIVVARQD